MNLQQLIEQYITFRQSLGKRFVSPACTLRAFGRTIGERAEANEVRAEQVNAFLQGDGPLTRTWHFKYTALRGLYRYAISRGYAAVSPLPVNVPKRPPSFVPYIYSREELRRLLDATTITQGRRRWIEPVTLRMILLLMYGAGLRVSEAVSLDRSDVDLEQAVVTVRDSKFFKSRLVPVGSQLTQALTSYAVWRDTSRPARGQEEPFFVVRNGGRVNVDTLQDNFRRLCVHASIRRLDAGRYQPRLHDLRHTFAVHRLTEWYQRGAGVQKLLPQLSVYLGHRYLAGTQVYLTMTPELLQQAAARFERYTLEEDGHDEH